jgi:hypothetical protein
MPEGSAVRSLWTTTLLVLVLVLLLVLLLLLLLVVLLLLLQALLTAPERSCACVCGLGDKNIALCRNGLHPRCLGRGPCRPRCACRRRCIRSAVRLPAVEPRALHAARAYSLHATIYDYRVVGVSDDTGFSSPR